MTVTANMPLIERLRKGANCVIFLDGAPEPAADVADMLRKAAAEIEQLQMTLGEIEKIANIAPTDDAYGSLAVRMNKVWLLARGHQQNVAAEEKP